MSEKESNGLSMWVRHKKAGFLLLMSVIIGCFFWAWWFMSRPVFGTVHVMPVVTVPDDEITPERRLYKGKNMTFSYEGDYDEKSSQVSQDGPILESVLLATTTLDGRKIAVTIANRGTDDLASDPSYQFRLNERNIYKQSSFAEGSYDGVMFEKNEAPFEKNAFFSVQGVIVSVALTSLFRSESLGVELEALLADFKVSSK